MKVGFISLGCSKNLIDTEVAIGKFQHHHMHIVNDPQKADMIVINTCGFIDSAKEEAIQTILEMAEYKKQKCRYLVVMGCLVERYYDDLPKAMPEVDLWIKLEDYDHFWTLIDDLIRYDKVEKSPRKLSTKLSEMKPLPLPTLEEYQDRVLTTGKNYAYLKIGEGCSNRCTYCAIPYIRGPFISRPQEEIVEEAKHLAKQGIKEIILIAQDTTKYGVDLYGESKLAELLQEISNIPEIHWVRFLYAYPEGITDELIEVVAKNDKVANYFDIPIQHISDAVLKRMNRRTNQKQIEELLHKIRSKISNVVLRTSIIVGFPGETKEDFDQLLTFIEQAKFDKLGAFPYSKEEGTPAAKLPEQIHGNTKKARYRKLMEKQQIISKEKLEEKIGQEVEILIEDISFDGKYFIGRTKQDVPEIDGVAYVLATHEQGEQCLINHFIIGTITKVNDYDVVVKQKK